ncbi:hypothetical protein TPL01_12640 [Sulfuriferula plumbiphila]|uniref:Uncharacterized protein n=1 Tax=Sulfuriferula plumbiphila TaxID=171865 RepID=A0A512L6M9_9PROT|nr:hypothetical protein SFPGR_22750 [Sulfuriferula plumbiphila]GEP30126.1 hypothetical protein TPL01_12640 [Sulfuriferula plumbiphila]
MDAQARTGFATPRAQFGLDNILQANQDDIQIRITRKAFQCGGDGDMRPVVTPHGIDCHGYISHDSQIASKRCIIECADIDINR